MDPYIGTTIDGKYKVTSLLGSGGLGTVYKAEQPELSRTVAIKILHGSAAMDADSRLRFDREARVLATLDHENIVHVYSFGLLPNGCPFMVMEFLEGMTLAQLKENLSWMRVVDLCIQVCAALQTAHKAGIIHRDLKPENVMVLQGTEQTVKVLDFGLSKVASKDAQKLTETGCLIGSINYMSPEVCAGQKADERSDIYSMGCIMYEALAKEPPFQCDSPIGMLHKHRTEMPAPLKGIKASAEIPKELELIVFKSLQKAPEDRFHSMADLKAALELVRSGRGEELSFSGVVLGGRRGKSVAPWMVLAGLVFVSICLVGGYACFKPKPVLELSPAEAKIEEIKQRIAKDAQENLRTARLKYKNVSLVDPADPADRLELARQLLNLHRYKEARENFTLACRQAELSKNSDSFLSRVLLGRGECIVEARDSTRWKEAEESLKKAIKYADKAWYEQRELNLLSITLHARGELVLLYASSHQMKKAREIAEDVDCIWTNFGQDMNSRSTAMNSIAITLAADSLWIDLKRIKDVTKPQNPQEELDLAALYLTGAHYLIVSREQKMRAAQPLELADELLRITADHNLPEWKALSDRSKLLRATMEKQRTELVQKASRKFQSDNPPKI